MGDWCARIWSEDIKESAIMWTRLPLFIIISNFILILNFKLNMWNRLSLLFYYHLDLELEHVDQVNTFYYHLLHWKSKRFSLKQYHEKLPTYLINQKTHSSSYTENLTDGCWSPTRPSVFFTARHDGVSFWKCACIMMRHIYVIWSNLIYWCFFLLRNQ